MMSFSLLLALELVVAAPPAHAEATVNQATAQEQAARNYLEQSNAAFAQSAMAVALGLSGMKASCGSSGSATSPSASAPSSKPAVAPKKSESTIENHQADPSATDMGSGGDSGDGGSGSSGDGDGGGGGGD